MDLIGSITDRFGQRKVVVIGDAVADQFLAGKIARVSREAPVFILRHEETVTLPGGAANAAANIAALGGRPRLVAVIGADANGDKLATSLSESRVATDHIVRSEMVPTTTKVRVLAGQHYAARQQVIRIDYEPGVIEDTVKDALREGLRGAADGCDAIVVSDYGYGAIFPELFADAVAIAAERGVPLIVDSRHRLADFQGATSATPNREEVEQILGGAYSADACDDLRERLGLKALLVTNGNKGMTLFEAGSGPAEMSAVGPTEPVDVTGAGDTVIAAYSLGVCSGLSFRQAAELANHAGGVVVMKKGTATVTAAELRDSIHHNTGASRVQGK